MEGCACTCGVLCLQRGRVLYTTEEMPTHSLQGWPTFFKGTFTDRCCATGPGELKLQW